MPQKAKRPCKFSGCPNITDNPKGYCDEHAKLATKNYDRWQRRPESKKNYGYRWRKIREQFLFKNPLCEICKKDGRFTEATEVHHVLPLANGGTHDETNLMALCKSCHSRITLRTENEGRGR